MNEQTDFHAEEEAGIRCRSVTVASGHKVPYDAVSQDVRRVSTGSGPRTISKAPGLEKSAQQSEQTFSAGLTCSGNVTLAPGQPSESLELENGVDVEVRDGVVVGR